MNFKIKSIVKDREVYDVMVERFSLRRGVSFKYTRLSSFKIYVV